MIMPMLALDEYKRITQQNKIIEEYEEFWREPHGSITELDEALDVIQAIITYITHEHDEDRIAEAVHRHYHKILAREGDRSYSINSILNITVKSKKAPRRQK